MKTCFKCGCEKPHTEFYKHIAMADGYLGKCKDCTKKDVWLHRHGSGREKVLAYDRERFQKNPERRAKSAEIVKRWEERFPERRRAQTAVGNAIRGKRLIRWPVCFIPTCNKKPEAHHPDYSAPLAVVWLCTEHHRAAHFINDEVSA